MFPPVAATKFASHFKPRAGDRFGESLSVYGNFLVVGCPQREDTWLHTGTVTADWEGEDVGAVYVYRRDSAEGSFSFFQVKKRRTGHRTHRGTDRLPRQCTFSFQTFSVHRGQLRMI